MTPILVPRFCFKAHCKFCDIKGTHFVDFDKYVVSTHEIKYNITCEHCYETACLSRKKKYHYVGMVSSVKDWNSFTPLIYHLNLN